MSALNAEILKEIGNGFYQTLKYEDALEIINIILAQSEEDLLSVGSTINAKKQPYYRSGMIHMKWGDYDKAIDVANSVKNDAAGLKITNELFAICGKDGFKKFSDFGLEIFLDLKIKPQ